MEIEYPPAAKDLIAPPAPKGTLLGRVVGNLFLICIAAVLIMGTIKIGMVLFG